MPNITHEIWNFIDKDPAIRKVLAMDLINIRALSNHIIKNLGIKTSVDAVVSALRRYPKEELKLPKETVDEVLKNSKISTKTRIVSIRIRRDPSLLSTLLPKVYGIIDSSVGEVIRLVEGRESVKMLVDKRKLDDVLAAIPKRDAEVEEIVLTEINVHFAEGYKKVTGLRASILNEFAINNIDVIETISCLPEFMVFINERHTAKAHDILLKFLYGDYA